MALLEIKNLHARVDVPGGREILKGVDLTIDIGEVHAIMGKNGSGKSTLCRVLAGQETYEVTEGSITYDGKDLLELSAEERASREGIFLAFQYPVEIPGVSTDYFLKAAVNAVRKHRGEPELDAMQFLKLFKERRELLEIDNTFTRRAVNEGFSGGEKKRNEVFQMAVMNPRLGLLDETDSGLDIDALKTVAHGINKLHQQDAERTILLVTHYQRLLNYVVPDFVHVMMDGRIVKSGGKELALDLEEKGYDWVEQEVASGITEMTQLLEEKKVHLSNFERFEKEGNGDTLPWLDELRKAGIARFDQVGFPDAKDEDWRQTNLQPIVRTKFTLAGSEISEAALEKVTDFGFGNDAISELVFINGHYKPQLSKLGKLPRGVVVESLAHAIESNSPRVRENLGRHASIEKNPFVALNTGFIRDGAYLFFPRGVTVEQPIHLLLVNSGGADGSAVVSHPRILIVAEENAEFTLVDGFVGAGGQHFSNVVTEVVAGDDCRIDHTTLQHESLESFHVSTLQVKLGRGAKFVSQSATLGGRVTRNDLNCVLAGEAAEATLNGLVIINGEQHCDNHTLLDHAAPNCPSHELYKHVLGGKSSGVFRGKILVRQAAQKTDSKQTSKSLLLSDDAAMNSQPALEIYADDVKCTHGSTIGPVDEDMMFYLRTRGVDRATARHLLTYAFAADITRRIRVEPVRRRLEDFMAEQAGLPQDLRITDLGAANEAHRT